MVILPPPAAILGGWNLIQQRTSESVYTSELPHPTLGVRKLGSLHTSLQESLEGHSRVANTLATAAGCTRAGAVVQE